MSRSKHKINQERCWYSDLLPGQCGGGPCGHGPGKALMDDDRPLLGAIVVAEHEGTCQAPSCEDRTITPGDHIGFMDEVKVPGKEQKVKRWAHYSCGR